MAPNSAVMTAIETLDYRVTPGDIATHAGLDVKMAERDLVALAADAGAHLQVSEVGDIAYLFPHNFRAILRRKSLRLRAEHWGQQIWQGVFYLIRISFGVLLILSIVLLAVTLMAIVLIAIKGSQQEDKHDRRSSNFPVGHSYGTWTSFQGWQLARLVSLCLDLFSNYSYQRPGHRNRSRPSAVQQPSSESRHDLNFLEAVFSFLFGDGNPNADLDDIRWQTIGAVIRHYQGAIIAEHIAPYLDNIPQGWAHEDEDYILSVLTRFNGRPAVSPNGQLIYYFPELQVTAAEQSLQSIPPYLREKRWQFSQAKRGHLTGAIALGAVNLILALLVGLYAFSDPFLTELQAMGLGAILWLYPLLLIYSIGFLGIPTLRYVWLKRRNRKLEQRNAERRQQANYLDEANPTLRTKLDFARQFAAQTVIAPNNLVYSTESDLISQDIDRV